MPLEKTPGLLRKGGSQRPTWKTSGSERGGIMENRSHLGPLHVALREGDRCSVPGSATDHLHGLGTSLAFQNPGGPLVLVSKCPVSL